ncbi:tubulin binding cofactor A [Polychytrium aggregatum]|uniref:tubulin binding cofactor A n=1 Tax=Polychytrium aggregatum TaxID=110093 RepID=UPI0022FDF995|nr:tubulin binding cofactor A [Polychytrium aggregatum]KAI9209407.1 tubulin binding cofactor A [Polychytrium aggregatum]
MSLRDLKIKTGVVKRLDKELSYYHLESTKQQDRIDKLKQSGADDADIRKQTEVLQETTVMIPDSKKRLEAAYKELESLLEKLQAENQEAEEVVAAQDILQQALPQLSL